VITSVGIATAVVDGAALVLELGVTVELVDVNADDEEETALEDDDDELDFFAEVDGVGVGVGVGVGEGVGFSFVVVGEGDGDGCGGSPLPKFQVPYRYPALSGPKKSKRPREKSKPTCGHPSQRSTIWA